MNSNEYQYGGVSSSVPGYGGRGGNENHDSGEILDVVPVTDELIEEDDSFNLDQYQVVRREFFSHISEPSITFNDCKVGLNTACIRRLPQIDYIQFLINRETKKLAIRPCKESELHSFQWCKITHGKRTPRQVTGRIFVMKLFTLMNWNLDHRYKVLGKLIRANNEYLFVFDLTFAEEYQRIAKEGGKTTISRSPILPSDSPEQFGAPYEEHRKAMQIDLFDNYVVYGIKDPKGGSATYASIVEHSVQHSNTPPALEGGTDRWQIT